MYDVIILGAGPSGLTAGIYSARGGLKTLIIEPNGIGGQAAITPDIVNYPGIKSIDGFSLVYAMKEQAESFGCEIINASFDSANLTGDIKTVVANGIKYESKSVIIASGANAKSLGVNRENELIGSGISYCATCDGGFFRGKPVAVVGGGNTAVEDALYLEKFASKVYLIHRRGELRASKILADKIENSSVQIVWNNVVDELIGTPLSNVVLKNVATNEKTTIDVKGLFVAVGRTPASINFDCIKKDDNGYIETDEHMHTNVKNVYAVGDVRQKSLRQIVTACADGAIAAEEIIKSL